MAQRLAVLIDGHKGKALWRAQQANARQPRIVREITQGLLLAIFVLRLQGFHACAVAVCFQRAIDRRAEFIVEVQHVAPERRATPGGQAQRARTVGIVEIIDVAKIAGAGCGGGLKVDEPAYSGVAPKSGGAENENVVAAARVRHAEAHCFVGTRLAEGAIARRDFSRGGKAQTRRVAAAQRVFRIQGGDGGHGSGGRLEAARLASNAPSCLRHGWHLAMCQ